MKDETGIGSAAFTRRDVLRTASLASLAAAFPGGLFAAGVSEKIRVGVIGCGGRGTGAAVDCATASPDVVIAALGDVFPDQLEWSLGQLKQKLAAPGSPPPPRPASPASTPGRRSWPRTSTW